MNGAVLLTAGGVFFFLAYILYSKYVARSLGVDNSRPTPAHTMNDGVDYVPAHGAVLFGHHFATIAGAGPIIGPVLAAQFGWTAVALWIVLGCIFIGAVHDMITLFLSVRHGGKSIGSIIESVLGRKGKKMFLLFCLSALILVMAEFTRQVAVAFVARPEVATSSLLAVLEAVVFGFCVYRLKMKVSVASFIFVPLLFLLVWVGTVFPCDLVALFGVTAGQAQTIWTIVILVYCFIASTLPVWIMLQPRDYLNAYLLYAMLVLGLLGIFFAVPPVQIDAFSGLSVIHPKSGAAQFVFPLLFVTVACGACSGFHALVSSGTTSKQLDKESHIRPIGYGSMLIEGIVALMALIAVASLSQAEYMSQLATMEPVQMFASNLAGFTTAIGLEKDMATSFMMLSVAAFLMTSVDSCTRLARFTWQELWTDSNIEENVAQTENVKSGFSSFMQNKFVATSIVVGVAVYLLIGNPSMSKNLWTLFASANQMLAALTLLTASLWLYKKSRNYWIALMPMLFMFVTSGTAVAGLFKGNLDRWLAKGFAEGGITAIASGALFVLAVILLVLGAVNLRRLVRERQKT